MNNKIKNWIPIGISTLLTCFWAFWGIIENFHEGWYFPTLIENIGLMIIQYLSPMLIFMTLTVIAIYYQKAGAVLHAVLAFFSIWFFRGGNPSTIILVASMFLATGILYWFSNFPHKRIAIRIVLGLPLMTLFIAGISPIVRVSQRIDDVNLQAHSVYGNNVMLTWAPIGPGWPREGDDWYESKHACQYLCEDGSSLQISPQNIWRLPTVDEAVHSMMTHGNNSGGVWNSEEMKATYTTRPDKEAPLWNIHSPVIYWWTSSEIDEKNAWMIEYDGQVWSREKTNSQTYLGFRCVRDINQ